jgi:hypothetical protein
MAEIINIPEDRPLTPTEVALVHWLLEHGSAEAADFIPQLAKARVASRCSCGCASVTFTADCRLPPGMQILADFAWKDRQGNRFGVFVFAEGGVLAGLDVYSVDGLATASSLPSIKDLEPAVEGWGA